MSFACRLHLIGTLSLVFAATASHTARAVDLEARNVRIHALDELHTRPGVALSGVEVTIPAPEGKKYLCIRLDIVGKNWEEGERNLFLKTEDFRLQVGEDTIPVVWKMQSPTICPPGFGQVFLNRPPGGETESMCYIGPIFLVPVGFTKGTFHVGEDIKLDIAAADAVPLESPTDHADFRVVEVGYVDAIQGSQFLAGQTLATSVKPAHGKLLRVTLEVTAKKANGVFGEFSFGARQLSLEFAGSYTPGAGQDRGGFSSMAVNQIKVGKTEKKTFYFVVSEKLKRCNLRYQGNTVAEISVGD